jgi:hypothetical protein
MKPCRVVIDAEKLRRINCGLGRFSLHLAEGMLDGVDGRIEPILLLPRHGDLHFGSRNIRAIRVRPWRKEFIRRWVRPLVASLAGRPAFDLWHMTNQMSRYEPLDPQVPMLLTVHDLTFLHEAPQDGRMREIERKRNDIQRRVDRSAAITVDTEFVAEDLRRELDIGGRPIHVIPLGLEPATAASAASKAGLSKASSEPAIQPATGRPGTPASNATGSVTASPISADSHSQRICSAWSPAGAASTTNPCVRPAPTTPATSSPSDCSCDHFQGPVPVGAEAPSRWQQQGPLRDGLRKEGRVRHAS